MSLEPGAHELGPPTGTVRLRTYRQGLAAKAGHDLVLEATAWHGHLVVPGEGGGGATVNVEIDLRSLVVLEGRGGMKPLTDGDKEEIRTAMQKPLQTADHPTARFASTEVRIDADRARIWGDLSLAGQTHPIELEAHRDGGFVLARAIVLQTAWGIKPYTGLLGALKLRDAVDLDISLPFPA